MSVSYQERELRLPVQLRDLLIDITLTSEMAIPKGIRSIDLGVLGKEAEELLFKTLTDPEGLERGRRVFVTPDGKMLLEQTELKGFKTQHGQQIIGRLPIIIDPRAALLPRKERQNQFLATTIHSHGPDDLPLSPTDIISLMYSEYQPVSVPCVFAITRQRKMLLFRSIETPRYSFEDAKKIKEGWDQVIYNASVVPELGVLPSEYQAQIQHTIVRQITEIMHLKAYSCSSDQNIAYLESA